MGIHREKVVVAMSGGVDSSVAACLLAEQGYEVIGLFMRVGAPEANGGLNAERSLPIRSARPRQGCCSASDAADARYVAGMLGISFYALNFEKDFGGLIDYFAEEYRRGRTPNPCVVCNHRLKFGKLLAYADAVGATSVATGHYARVEARPEGYVLRRAIDARKDQSYVLFGLDRKILPRVRFPVGGLSKAQVREVARRYGLPNCDKPDSVEICFVPDGNYAQVVRDRRPEAFTEGDVVDETGHFVGRHRGIGHYTVGQRRGLGIAAGSPIYVTRIDAAANTITVGHEDALLCSALHASGVNFLCPEARPVGSSFRAEAKIRYLHTPASATVHVMEQGRVHVEFDEPQRAVTPGQAVVFYDDDVVVGGAWIDVPARHRRTGTLMG